MVCLSFFDLRILITPLVSSNYSSEINNYKHLESNIEFVMQDFQSDNPMIIHTQFGFIQVYSFSLK